MRLQSTVLGIDIGSVSVSLALLTTEKRIVGTGYAFHQGSIEETLRSQLSSYDFSSICGVAVTSSTPAIVRADRRYDNRISVIDAGRMMHECFSAILMVGGEKFGVIRFDEFGNYVGFHSNTSCAAGTGSFLDQQAGRLGLTSIADLTAKAFANTDNIPKIASRCAVFAKTDLVHAQQEGHSLEQICDGLCLGLARNIVDTLFSGDNPTGPVLFVGGVSKNRAVVGHLQKLIGQELIPEKYPYGAVGSALHLIDETAREERRGVRSMDDLFFREKAAKKWFYPPLQLRWTRFPEFDGLQRFVYLPTSPEIPSPLTVEVDIYEPIRDSCYRVLLGIDIGSTSTKAVLLEEDHTVLAGFYTRTAGRPVNSVKSIFEAVEHVCHANRARMEILGAGTTGSGRKFVGRIIGADLILDEITAHARGAVELNPQVDTIIEIGGQDSKFTTLKDGMVTFSVMNTVCAAGTGSFIEEQAQKLGCPLSDYARRAENRRSPIASDRCTVFMERDINHLLSEGYDRDEALATVLHSIVENYLTKVAIEGSIGEVVFFQGATAKNKALVAAFEQRLGKPIYVSRFCHLTGAMGAALSLSDSAIRGSNFQGINLYRSKIDVKSEVCELCTNHCKLSVAEVENKKIAYGFLCGRDYETRSHVDGNRSGFDLLKTRKKLFSGIKSCAGREGITIGLPDGLYMSGDLPFWKQFFALLSIRTVTSSRFADSVKTGKKLAGAEFCAPLASLHGQVAHLLERADYVFLPFYLEKKTPEKNRRRQYCYYSQFAPVLLHSATSPKVRKKLLRPLCNYLYSSFHDKVQLYQMLKTILPGRIGFFELSNAYDTAVAFVRSGERKLKEVYREQAEASEPHVVLLGRPYTVLSPWMNKRIPEIFGSLGVKAFYQDMLSYEKQDLLPIDHLLGEVHWEYASKILEAACATAQTRGAYPVLVTSFKCTPDAFVMEYFKQVMEAYEKPYLILQLDEHDSSVGYETRIEAAIRSFNNHHRHMHPSADFKQTKQLKASRERKLEDKTLLIPNWDDLSLRLVVSALQRRGVDARLLEGTEASLQKSLRSNTGQCIPLNIIAQEAIDHIHAYDLDPARTVLWMVESSLACNLALFPHHIKTIFRSYGNGMERVGVYKGAISFMDISMRLPINVYFAYLYGGLMRKIGCKIRPYECEKGETDRVVETNMEILVKTFLYGSSKEAALEKVISNFENIRQRREGSSRPKVAIFGDLYVRDNERMNQDLIHFIEENGGEVVVTPFSSHVKMIAKPYFQKWLREGLYLTTFSTRALLTAVNQLERNYQKYFRRILPSTEPLYDDPPRQILSAYGMRIENTGESIENVLKIHYTRKQHPDISLFVQTSPAFCCPSLVTEAMAKEIERKTGVPIVSITYDGTGGSKNDAVIPYLKYPRIPKIQNAERKFSDARISSA